MNNKFLTKLINNHFVEKKETAELAKAFDNVCNVYYYMSGGGKDYGINYNGGLVWAYDTGGSSSQKWYNRYGQYQWRYDTPAMSIGSRSFYRYGSYCYRFSGKSIARIFVLE